MTGNGNPGTPPRMPLPGGAGRAGARGPVAGGAAAGAPGRTGAGVPLSSGEITTPMPSVGGPLDASEVTAPLDPGAIAALRGRKGTDGPKGAA